MVNVICYGFVSILLARAMYTDVLERKIENRVVVIGMLGSLLYLMQTSGVDAVWDAGKNAVWLWLLLYVLYLIRGLGAGDVKLMVMVSMWIPQYCLEMAAGAFIAGAVIACGRMGVRWLCRQQVYIRGETIPFAIPIACSFAGCVVIGGIR